jgi:hypothetical protein
LPTLANVNIWLIGARKQPSAVKLILPESIFEGKQGEQKPETHYNKIVERLIGG